MARTLMEDGRRPTWPYSGGTVMEFRQAIDETINRAGWTVEMYEDRGDRIVRKVRASSGKDAAIAVYNADVAGTWNTWDESKRQRGKDKLATSVSQVLRVVREGMIITLQAHDWTPDA
jgi:hypothetical protein